MSVFPTTVLLAIDGSEDARLAVTTAVELANSTGSELHVVLVEEGVYVSGVSSTWTGVPGGYPFTDREQAQVLEQRARKQLDEEVEEVRSAGAMWHGHILGKGMRPRR